MPHAFYEARPVKPKICPIGSTFYPSFHEGDQPFYSWSHSTYATMPILGGELEAQGANQAIVVPNQIKLQTFTQVI